MKTPAKSAVKVGERKRHWGVHSIAGIYDRHVEAGLPDGRWVLAVAEPYSGNRLRAAWEVLCGRAFAFEWPRAGDLEDTIGKSPFRAAIQKERGEAYQNGWNDGYAEGEGKALATKFPDGWPPVSRGEPA